MPEKTEPKVTFKKCDCGADGGAHGYFYVADVGRCPYPTFSMESAAGLLKKLAGEKQLTSEEVGAVQGQIRAAGLQEAMDDNERAMLAQYAAEVEVAKLLEQVENEIAALMR